MAIKQFTSFPDWEDAVRKAGAVFLDGGMHWTIGLTADRKEVGRFNRTDSKGWVGSTAYTNGAARAQQEIANRMKAAGVRVENDRIYKAGDRLSIITAAGEVFGKVKEVKADGKLAISWEGGRGEGIVDPRLTTTYSR